MYPDIPSLVGQWIMFRFMGPELQASDIDAFKRIRPCGVLYFGDNLTSFDQIRALSAQLQELARVEGMPPLYIAADQEGGIVTRFPPDMITVASAMGIGPLPDELIRENARLTARQLLAVGINTNFAPTIDINSNPHNPVIRTRSFGENANIVSRAGLATVAGMIDEGVIPTVKHFPGHGNTHIDSHHGLPVIEASLGEIHTIELAPFKAAIAAGVPGIMTAHIRFPALDDLPATLSRRILTGLLREELGFEGVIFTDSMTMEAITRGWGIGESSIMAKQAGVDVLESSEPAEGLLARHAALVEAVESGRLSLEIFQATANRLDELRQRFGIGRATPAEIHLEEIRERAVSIAQQTIRSASGLAVPVVPNSANTVVIQFARLRNLEVVDRFDLPSVLEHAIAAQLPAATMITLSCEPTDEEIEGAVVASSGATTLIVCTRDAIQHEYQRRIGQRLVSAAPVGTHIIHVNLRGPYDVGLLGNVDETVFTYGDAVVSLRALAMKLAGSATHVRVTNVPDKIDSKPNLP
ncbi:MAG: glycoside hydrolase family 3 protein [Thermomicrobiales bacterium]|nr:glycoside hydrolase family 3 protein [Thermomicrobiales bacterium]MCO5224031.1 glycoside hydrolase family 3 protein [Thermomicrobiales bacterium]MCO5226851.1 glycoside hydrolase family 3 protein [Thermomicrobiales bacterium]